MCYKFLTQSLVLPHKHLCYVTICFAGIQTGAKANWPRNVQKTGNYFVKISLCEILWRSNSKVLLTEAEHHRTKWYALVTKKAASKHWWTNLVEKTNKQTNIPKQNGNQCSWDSLAVLTEITKFPTSLLLQHPEVGAWEKSDITTKLHFPLYYYKQNPQNHNT